MDPQIYLIGAAFFSAALLIAGIKLLLTSSSIVHLFEIDDDRSVPVLKILKRQP